MNQWRVQNASDDYSHYQIEAEGHGIIMRVEDCSDNAVYNAYAIAALPQLIASARALAELVVEREQGNHDLDREIDALLDILAVMEGCGNEQKR